MSLLTLALTLTLALVLSAPIPNVTAASVSTSVSPPVSTPVSVASASPQQITWFYANDLAKGAAFLADVLGLDEVMGLIQADRCRIFHATMAPSAAFLGVCTTRKAPECSAEMTGDAVPATYTFVHPTRADVIARHAALLPLNGTTITVTEPGGSPAWGAFAFNLYDTDVHEGLGCYRFEVQTFDDPAWPNLP